MPRLYAQPSDGLLGNVLQTLLGEERWQTFSVAVAWVRRSGTRQVGSSLSAFLGRGGISRFIVGIDIENTSEEGLIDLLALQQFGRLEIFVNHNEAAPTYHPKVYLFEDAREGCLIVGSNNLTEAGLFTNDEAALHVVASMRDPLMVHVRRTLDRWSDASTGLVKKLDEDVLRDLVSSGYVLSEAIIKERRRANRESARRVRENSPRYFAAIPINAPAPPPWPVQTLSVVPDTDRGVVRGAGAARAVSTRAQLVPGREAGVDQVLVAAAPKSRAGWSQLQLNLDVLRDFFHIPAVSGERLTLRERRDGGGLAPPEERTIVFAPSNKNVKVEIGAARGRAYPPEGYPIVIFRRLTPRNFEYVIRLPGDSGHQELTDMLNNAQDTIGRGHPRVIRSLNDVLALWPGCPLPPR